MNAQYKTFGKQYKELLDQVNIVLTLDHGGRGGSNYFQCLFDKHQVLIMCPLVHYVYSYWLSAFQARSSVSAIEAHHFISQNSYFRLLYNNPEGEHETLIYRIGGDPQAPFDRALYRSLIDEGFQEKESYTRKEIIILAMAAYAFCRGIPLKGIKYFGLNDSASTRTENVYQRYELQICDLAFEDFPGLKILSLWRDPRAQFASTRQQLVNQYGGNYNLSDFPRSLMNILSNNEGFETGPASYFAILYQRSAFYSLLNKLKSYKSHSLFIRNEDFNLNFVPTMTTFCKALDIPVDAEWLEKGDSYTVTMMGRPWGGTGSYNPRYQTAKNLVLSMEDAEKVKKTLGPNKHVTQRWKTKVPKAEQRVLKYLFQEELQLGGYEDLSTERNWRLLLDIWYPTLNEFYSFSDKDRGAFETLSKNIAALIFYFLNRAKILFLYYATQFFITDQKPKLVEFIRP